MGQAGWKLSVSARTTAGATVEITRGVPDHPLGPGALQDDGSLVERLFLWERQPEAGPWMRS